MKRVWFALILMLLLGLGGLTVTAQVDRICRPIAAALEQAAPAAAEEAGRLCADARQKWEQSRKFLASVTDHEPMEEVDALFRSLEVYLHHEDGLHFSQACAQLASQVRAIGESQCISWWNIF